ncbi:dihydrodipicolinate synthase family protein [bacterium]|nr:dihydrodipicolinate synthase family protein [bacterium]
MTSPPWDLCKPGRPIRGMSAILLPWLDEDQIDWPSWEAHLLRTADAGLTPAINMDTGYVNLISDAHRQEILARAEQVLGGGSFVAGAIVVDSPGSGFDLDTYRRRIRQIVDHGGTPIIFPSFGLTSLLGPDLLRAYESLASDVDEFLAFELGLMFAPFGKILDLDTYAGLLSIRKCIGAKHSSLSRELEWDRLRCRDRVRPEFMVLTGNDLAIDMVMFGSDYLLGLSTMAPDLFARRDRYWQDQDARFFELNDGLQALGAFTFREPVPAYKHSAAQFLFERGWIKTSRTHRASPTRPESDRDVLRQLADRLGILSPGGR